MKSFNYDIPEKFDVGKELTELGISWRDLRKTWDRSPLLLAEDYGDEILKKLGFQTLLSMV